jgi:hypothetical protein
MKRVKIYRNRILDALRSYANQYGEGKFDLQAFGLTLNRDLGGAYDPFIHFYVLDKEKLIWAMMMYGFNIYYVDSCF